MRLWAISTTMVVGLLAGCGEAEEDPPQGVRRVESLTQESAPAGPPVPTEIFVWFADGGPAPVQGLPCLGRTPPAFTCSFASSPADCRQAVLAQLAHNYRDFHVVFTDRPPGRGAGSSVVVTSGGDWCGQATEIGGLAPVVCAPMSGAVSYAFQCGRNADLCAGVIAQEQAHTLGLAHTDSGSDIMHPVVRAGRAFEDRDSATVGSRCRTRQNSYRMMLERLGRRPITR